MTYPFLGIMGMTNKAWHHQKYAVVSSIALAFLEYLTTSDTSSFTLRSYETGTLDYEVDWGDGTVETLTTAAPTHTYSSAGQYTIKVTPAEGSTYRPYYDNDASAASIASVSSTGGSQLGTSLQDAWDGASNMTSFGGNIDTSSVINFFHTWRGCQSLTSFPQLDVSSGGNFNYAWGNCSGLTSFPQLDVSNGGSFNFTWQNCSGLTSFPQLDVSNGGSFNFAWNSCSGLTSFPQLNFSNGNNFNRAWSSCSGLTSFPANMFDITRPLSSTSFVQSFSNCSLTAQSIENILVSLDTNGASNITLGIGGGSNAGYSTWTAAAQTALANLQAKGWTISYNL